MTQVAQQPYPATIPGQPTMTILYTAQGVPVQVVNVNTNDGTYQHYNTKAARILGILQIVLGILIIISQIVVTAVEGDGYQGFVGFWASVFFILAGIFGVLSAKYRSRCTVIVTMILSIIAAVFSTGAMSQGAVGAAISSEPSYKCYQNYDSYDNDYETGCSYYWTSEDRLAIAFHIIMAVLGLIEGIVAIVAAAYCCHGCCCRSSTGLVFATPGLIPLHQAVQYQKNPAGCYNVPHTTGGGAPYESNPSAPAYHIGSTPPPQYVEKV